MSSYADVALQYAEDVVKGRVPACNWVKLACIRQQKDLKRAGKKTWPFYFDQDQADLVCETIELFPHVKGEWATRGETIKLEPWQIFIVTTVFGWRSKETGLRRFRTAYIEVPRKNAKSTLSAAMALYMLALDGEYGAELYSAATTRDQARIIWEIAQVMVKKSPEFRATFKIAAKAHAVTRIETNSLFQPLSSEANSLEGLNTHYAAIDELHAHKTRKVYDVMESSTGSRSQPLLWNISTAGVDLAGICYEQHNYVTKILQSIFEDETYFGIIYTIDEGDDWSDEKIWKKANPNYGVSVKPDDIKRLHAKASKVPSSQANFLTKRLDVWVGAGAPWMDMIAWAGCADFELEIEEFKGEPCFAALDLASKTDIAALVLLFEREGEYYAFGRWYLPEETIKKSGNAQYDGWRRKGKLITTEGNIIDLERIEDDLKALSSDHEVLEVPYDPFQATQFSTRMIKEGFPMVEMRPTVLNFSEPMKELEALVIDGRFHHDGDPVFTWMASNVVAHLDNKDNIYPRKELFENKIDGIVATIMALGRAIVFDKDEGVSIYEDEGDRPGLISF